MPNILDILGPVGGPRGVPNPIQQIDPGASAYAPRPSFDEAFASIAQPPVAGRPIIDLGAGAPGPTQVNSNILAKLAPLQNVSERTPRERKSLLDIIGGIADTVATVGGADPLYSMNRDAATERARMVDLDAMRKLQFEQQQRLGDQQYRTGELGIQNDERARIGETLASVVGAEDPLAAWGAIAAQTGLPPDKAAAIGAALQQGVDPGRLAQSFGYAPQAKGSDAAIAQEYELRARTLGVDAANEWLRTEGQAAPSAPKRSTYTVNAGDRIEEYDIDTGNLVRTIPVGAKPSAAPSLPAAGDNQDVKNILLDFGIALEGEQDPVADLIRNSTSGRLESWASMIPAAFGNATTGQENIGRLETIDNALVLALAGGKLGAGVSNADRDFFKEMSGKISDPAIPIGQRLAAWDQVKSRLRGILSRSTKPAASPPSRGASRPSAASVQDTPAMAEARRRGLL